MNQGIVLSLLLVIMNLQALACQVPVFRYALERWTSDAYQVSVLHEGALLGEAAEALQQLREAAADTSLNVQLVAVHDLANMTEEESWLIEPGTMPLPQIQVRYPLGAKVTKLLWRAPLTQAEVTKVLDSPIRERVRSNIVSGASAAWVLIETEEDEAQNQAALASLTEHLQVLEEELTLPEGVIGNEAFAAGTVDATVPGFEMDNVLRSTIPLQIQFPIVRLRAGDDKEAFFRAMLLGSVPYLDGDQLKEPVAVPVFGRGRMMHGLPASRLTLETLKTACTYLCGACSCQVKEQNPGIDLLMRAQWDDLLQGQLMIRERALPPLAGVGDLQTNPSVELAASEPSRQPSDHLRSTLLFALGGVLILIAVASGVLFLRTRRS